MLFVVLSLEEKSEEMTKEEKNLALMAMKKKDKRLYDRIMHSKKKKRSEVRQARSRTILNWASTRILPVICKSLASVSIWMSVSFRTVAR